MSTEQRCMGCMQPLETEGANCPHCQYPTAGVNPPEYLPIRTVLNERYMVGRVLEIGGDSAVYIGLDQQDGSRVTVREFFPPLLAKRAEGGCNVIAAEGQEDVFAACRGKYLALARAVARLRDVLVVVPSYDIFEENGTAYSVSEYCEGTSLEKYVIAHGGKLPVEEVRRMFLPLISAVSTIHATGVLHLALSPKNILVDEDGHLRLKNFAISEVRTQSGIGKPSRVAGCAAPEQYQEGVTPTAAADVYGLAASMFFALTGHVPAEPSQRQKKGDELMMPANVADAMPPYIKESLYRALRLSPERRTQTAQQLLDELSTTQAVASLRVDETEKPVAKKKKKNFPYIIVIFSVVLVIMVGVMLFLLNQLGFLGGSGGGTATTTTQANLTMKSTTYTTTYTTGALQDALFPVKDYRGFAWSDIVKDMSKLPGDMTVVIKGYQYCEEGGKGIVVSQNPAPNARVERGTVIEVMIGLGPQETVMPDVSGWKADQAKLYLEALGYSVTLQDQLANTTYDRGYVEGSSPAAGKPVQAGDKVTLNVSAVDKAPEQTPGLPIPTP